MATITYQGETYTEIDNETFANANGHEISSWERAEAVSELKRAERELARAGRQDLTDGDAAATFIEALEIRNAWDETLELINFLWPR